MISTSFLKICKELIFAKKKKVLNAALFQNIDYCLNFTEKFYKKTAPGDVPVFIKNELDLIKMACRTRSTIRPSSRRDTLNRYRWYKPVVPALRFAP